MKAIILAAGRGSRMGPETEDKPKCLATLGGRTLIEWQVAALREAGVQTVIGVGGYRHVKVEPFVDVLAVNERWDRTNMVMSLAEAASFLMEGPCVVSYSDIVYHPDAVRALMMTGGDIAITYDTQWHALWSLRFEDPLDDAETFRTQGGVLQEIGAKTRCLDDIAGQYMGLFKITPEGWRAIARHLDSLDDETRNRLDVTALLRQLMQAGIPIHTTPVNGKWCEVDNVHDRDAYATRLSDVDSRDATWSHDWRW